MLNLNLNVSGIVGKLQKNAEWLAFLAGAYERFGNLGGVVNQLNVLKGPQAGVILELQRCLADPNILKYKLLDSPHLYTTMFKGSIIAYLLAELGIIIPSKYKKLATKIAWGSGIAALTMPGSGPYQSSNSNRGSSGSNPMEGVYNL